MGFMDVCITLILKGGNGTYVNSNANTKKHICMPILRILCEIILSINFTWCQMYSVYDTIRYSNIFKIHKTLDATKN